MPPPETEKRRPAGNQAAHPQDSHQAAGLIHNGSPSPRQHATLHIPDVIPGDLLGAALAYAAAGWFVGPLDMKTKHPGSVLGDGWPDKTFRDFDNIDRWFNGTRWGLFLHVGHSGAIAFDVDHPAELPDELAGVLRSNTAPFQSTRPDEPLRGHYLYSAGGRRLSNSTKGFGAGWGEIRSHNAIIVVYPTQHSAGGRYQWIRTGVLPQLPVELAKRCRDVEDRSAGFQVELGDLLPLADHTECERMRLRREKLLAELTSGGSRHEAITGGLVDLVRFGTEHPGVGAAIVQVRELFVGLVTADKSRSMSTAVAEFERSLTGALAIIGADVDFRSTQDGCIVMSDPPWHPGDPLPSQSPPERAADPPASKPDVATTTRRVHITWASEIEMAPVVWAWIENDSKRIPAGSLILCAGREGTGKSSFGIWTAARISRGTLPGSLHGTPRRVLYVAIEDSWRYTIGPRLTAAGADMSLVGRVDVMITTDDEGLVTLSLPYDIRELERTIVEFGVAMVVIDPLMSVMGEDIDTHRNREVRRALEPLVRLADTTGVVIAGIAHFNKGSGSDAAALITGSGAFKDVPRAIFGFVRDNDGGRVMSQVKNSLGRDDLPSLSYRIDQAVVNTKKGPAETGLFVFTGESDRSVEDILRDGKNGDDDSRSESSSIVAWLRKHLVERGGSAPAAAVIQAGEDLGFTAAAVKSARQRARKPRVTSKKTGFQAAWIWTIQTDEGGTNVAESLTHTITTPSIPCDNSEDIEGSKKRALRANATFADSGSAVNSGADEPRRLTVCDCGSVAEADSSLCWKCAG